MSKSNKESPYQIYFQDFFGILKGPMVKEVDPSSDMVQSMNPVQQFMAEQASQRIKNLIESGDLSHVQLEGRVLDFGCGDGGPTHALSLYGGDITAVDLSQRQINELVSKKILPVEKTVCGDGIEYMRAQPDESFDLVMAFMLDPSIGSNPLLFREFYAEANRIIKVSGRVVIQSDAGTFSSAMNEVGIYGKITRDTFAGYRVPPSVIKSPNRELAFQNPTYSREITFGQDYFYSSFGEE